MLRIILLLLILNTLLVVGGTAFNYFMLQSSLTSLALPGEPKKPEATAEYKFFPIEKVIVSLKGETREHYFVLDLVLQADLKTDSKKLEQIDPMVRNSVVAHLSSMHFDTLRNMSIPDLQASLVKALDDDFTSRHLAKPFADVLVSKMIVQ